MSVKMRNLLRVYTLQVQKKEMKVKAFQREKKGREGEGGWKLHYRVEFGGGREVKEGLQVRLLGTAETRFPALPQAAENAVQRFLGLHARQLVQLKLQRALRHSLFFLIFFLLLSVVFNCGICSSCWWL